MYNNTAEDASALIWAPKTFVGRTKVNCFWSYQVNSMYSSTSFHHIPILWLECEFLQCYFKKNEKKMYR